MTIFTKTQKSLTNNSGSSLFCPETGLKVSSVPRWINQKVSDTFEANFSIIGDSIIYSLPKGVSDLKGVQKSLVLNDEVANFVSEGNGAYIQIEDYALLNGSSTAARRYFTRNMNNNKRRLSIIFCNLSTQMSIAVKIGKRFNSSYKNIHVAKQYRDAVRLAVELSGRDEVQNDTDIINICQAFADKERSLTPVDILSKDSWNIDTPGYSNRVVIIDQCILHSTSAGYFETKHIPLIERMRDQCHAALSGDSSIKYIIVDSSHLKGGSRVARARYMQSLKNWHQLFPYRMYILYNTNTFMKAALHLAKPFMPFKTRIAKNIPHAFQLIREDQPGNQSEKKDILVHDTPAVVQQADIDKLIAVVGSLNWESKGTDIHFDIQEDHPFYLIYQSIKLIKEEIDDLFMERKLLEDQLLQSRKMESIGTLTGGIAHDFNNLLYVIIGNTELALEDTPESSPAHESLTEIKTVGLKAAGIVQQLLSFSRKAVPVHKPIEIIGVLKDTLQFLRSTIPVTISIQQHFMIKEAIIIADPIQINQVLMNICINAAQAMETTVGIIEVSVEYESLTAYSGGRYANLPHGNYIKITISDTGPGIDLEIIDRIFDPYFTTKEVGKGSGMGLAVVLGIVQNHEGAIFVDNKPENGAIFTILLPVALAKAESEVTVSDVMLHGNETILFVDDEKFIVELTQKMLGRLGYKIATSQNPSDAFNLFQSNPGKFDLVITDMTMPQMTGLQLAEKLKEIRSDIPVIICTGYSSLIDKNVADQSGIEAFVMKPLSMLDISKVIRQVLDN